MQKKFKQPLGNHISKYFKNGILFEKCVFASLKAQLQSKKDVNDQRPYRKY
jgi:hypothetical protein